MPHLLQFGMLQHTTSSRGCNGGKRQEQLSLATLSISTASHQELGEDRLAYRPSFGLLQKPFFRVQVVAGSWVWIVEDLHESARFSGLTPSAKKSLKIRTQSRHIQLENPRQNPHQKSAPNPHPKSAPKSAPNRRTQTPHPNSTPKSEPKLSTNKNDTKNLCRDSGELDGNIVLCLV